MEAPIIIIAKMTTANVAGFAAKGLSGVDAGQYTRDGRAPRSGDRLA
jgi:hypothetical protein